MAVGGWGGRLTAKKSSEKGEVAVGRMRAVREKKGADAFLRGGGIFGVIEFFISFYTRPRDKRGVTVYVASKNQFIKQSL